MTAPKKKDPENKGPERPMRKIRFMNIESPDLDISFASMAPGGEIEKYTLNPGDEYTLPVDVINYLNNLSYPIYNLVADKKTGQVKSQRTGSQNRFSCVPVE